MRGCMQKFKKLYGDFDPVKRSWNTFLNTLNIIFQNKNSKSNNYNL
jgi:hypothetical protein